MSVVAASRSARRQLDDSGAGSPGQVKVGGVGVVGLVEADLIELGEARDCRAP